MEFEERRRGEMRGGASERRMRRDERRCKENENRSVLALHA